MKPNRSSLALTLMVMALLLTHTSGTFAQESAQVTKKPKPPSLWVLNETYGYDISIFAAAQLSRKTGTVAASGMRGSSPAPAIRTSRRSLRGSTPPSRGAWT